VSLEKSSSFDYAHIFFPEMIVPMKDGIGAHLTDFAEEEDADFSRQRGRKAT